MMKLTHHLFIAAFFFLYSHSGLIVQPYQEARSAGVFYDIPESFKGQIDRAIPSEVASKPGKERKLLVYSQYLKERVHSSVPYANYAFYQMGETTGAYQTYFSNDTAVFQAKYLDQFDAVMLNNTAGVLFNDPETRQHLLDFVYGGKGIIGIHAGAGATFVKYPVYDQFPEFGQMMGGYENGGHPWKTWEWINFKVDEPDHPVNKGFSVSSFDISDEIYQYLNEYSRDRVRILLSINTEKTDMENRYILPERRLDNDFPVSWVREYGNGRVFSSALGHHPHINWDMRVLSHYFRGIQFALGDLKAPTTPTGKLNAVTQAQEITSLPLGIEAYSFKNQTFFDVIDHATEMGVLNVGGLSFQKVSPEINKNFDQNLSREELLKIRSKLLDAGMRLKTYYIHDIPNDRKACEKIFQFGQLMGIETFISEPDPKALDLIEQFCEAYNIKLAIHNHGQDISPEYYDPAKLLSHIKNRSELIGVCGDTGYWTRSGFNAIESIEKLGGRLITLQLHDLNELTPNGHDVPWGSGASEINRILSTLVENKIKPTMVGLEYSYNWDKSDSEIKQSIDSFSKFITNIAAGQVK